MEQFSIGGTETPAQPKLDEPIFIKKESEAKKKPDWLQELTRKQANRRSGFIAEGLPEQPPPLPNPALKPGHTKQEGNKIRFFEIQYLAYF